VRSRRGHRPRDRGEPDDAAAVEADCGCNALVSAPRRWSWILGASGVADVTAAGALLTATGTRGALGSAAWALADRLWPARRPKESYLFDEVVAWTPVRRCSSL